MSITTMCISFYHYFISLNLPFEYPFYHIISNVYKKNSQSIFKCPRSDQVGKRMIVNSKTQFEMENFTFIQFDSIRTIYILLDNDELFLKTSFVG